MSHILACESVFPDVFPYVGFPYLSSCTRHKKLTIELLHKETTY